MKTTQAEHSAPGRRLWLSLTILAVSVTWPAADRVFAQATSPVIKINEEAAKADITVEQLRGNISVLTGSGGNIVVLASPEGKLMVDSGIAVSRPRIQAALDRLGPRPPRSP